MIIEDQVCLMEQAKELRKLGVVQDSQFYHFPQSLYNWKDKSPDKELFITRYDVLPAHHVGPRQHHNLKHMVLKGYYYKTYSAFTVAELFVMLGENFVSWLFMHDSKLKWIATILDKNTNNDGINVTTAPSFDRFGDTQAEALATLLIAVIKTGFIKIEDVNARLMATKKAA